MKDITMKFGIVEIYLMGFLLMIAYTGGNTYTVIRQLQMGVLMPSQSFSAVISLLFNGLWVYFFWFMFKVEVIKKKKEQEALKSEKPL